MSMNEEQDISIPELNEADMRLDAQLCFALYSAMHAFTKVYRDSLAGMRLTYPQYLVLMVLWENDELTVSAICKRLRLETTTVTPLLKRMEARGLLERTRSKEDERQVIVSLTEQGHTMQQEAKDIPACMTHAVALPDDEFKALKAQLETLRENLTTSRQASLPS